ncbi:uncharacterized protein LOC132755286 [Ruditapes philippinarum]|uniref:uncharacterized protein LOC132755286 n=1 Tax=Ruditapes philippinarum TaxID=129788 RepID=UPI00295A7A15|nr:uncharacterized protein LOC132755286 [Ruditapes philippinarum]
MATCESIKQTAFDSHPSCYLYPDFGKPSICEIGCDNWVRIFWTVKGALIQDAIATVKQMWDVYEACDCDVLSLGMEMIRLVFRHVWGKIVTNLNKMAQIIANQISRIKGWYKRGVLIFGFPTPESPNRNKRSADNNTDLFYVNLLIAAQSEFDLNAPNMLATNVSAEAISVAKAIENGEIRLDIEEGIEFTGLSICIDYNCTETSLQVTPAQQAQQEKQDKGGVNRTTIIVVVCAVTFGMILVVSGVVILKKVRRS